MRFKFIEEKDRGNWDEFISENGGDFLQSWDWGDLQGLEGSVVRRFSVHEGAAHVASFQVHSQKTRLGDYLYVPHGPVFKSGYVLDSSAQKDFAEFLKTIDQKIMFILCEPLHASDLSDFQNFKNLQPRKTLIIDLTRVIEEIRKDIAYSRRQGIGFAVKKGVLISHGKTSEYRDAFVGLIKKTSARHDFGIFNASHYDAILKFLPTEIFTATHEGNFLAAAQVIFWGNTVTYLHAGSDDANKKLRAPDLMIWTIIEEAKKRGFKKFDFWGIDEQRWPGVTMFKKSFGGSETEFSIGKIVVNDPIRFLAYTIYKKLRTII